MDLPEMRQALLLGLLHVAEQRPRGSRRGRLDGEALPVRGLAGEIGIQAIPGGITIKVVRRQKIHEQRPGPLPESLEPRIRPVLFPGNHLPETQSRRLGQKELPVPESGDPEVAGGDVQESQSVCALADTDGGEEVVLLGPEVVRLQDQTRRHNADHIPLHDPFCLPRIFHLLADGDLESVLDEPGDVTGRGVPGYAAEGNGVLLPLVSRRQGDVQDGRRRDGVVEEHLVEVAHPEEENAVGILLLERHILAHGGGQVPYSHRSPPRRVRSMVPFPERRGPGPERNPGPGPEKKELRIQLTMLIRRAPRTAGQNPWTSNPGITPEAIFRSSALMTRVNSPRVRIFTGSVTMMRTGLRMVFRIPRVAAAKKADQKLATWMPSTK